MQGDGNERFRGKVSPDGVAEGGDREDMKDTILWSWVILCVRPTAAAMKIWMPKTGSKPVYRNLQGRGHEETTKGSIKEIYIEICHYGRRAQYLGQFVGRLRVLHYPKKDMGIPCCR